MAMLLLAQRLLGMQWNSNHSNQQYPGLSRMSTAAVAVVAVAAVAVVVVVMVVVVVVVLLR